MKELLQIHHLYKAAFLFHKPQLNHSIFFVSISNRSQINTLLFFECLKNHSEFYPRRVLTVNQITKTNFEFFVLYKNLSFVETSNFFSFFWLQFPSDDCWVMNVKILGCIFWVPAGIPRDVVTGERLKMELRLTLFYIEK